MAADAPAVPRVLPADPIVDPLASFTRHRRFNAPIARALGADMETAEIAKRVAGCAGRLGLRLELPEGGPVSAQLESAHLCQARLCPFCEWRRTRAWRARVIRGLTRLQAEHPSWRALFLTLTVRNCALSDLRQTIDDMHAGWGRMTKLRGFPSAYWLRRTEVTVSRATSGAGRWEAPLPTRRTRAQVNDITQMGSVMPLSCHPHLHALLIVPASYFGRDYIRQTRWREMWQMSARLDYAPVVDVRNVYRKGDDASATSTPVGAICEAAKYATKATDVLKLGADLPELHRQIRGLRLIGVSRPLAPYVPTSEPQADELMDEPAVGPAEGLAARVAAVWDQEAESYRFEL